MKMAGTNTEDWCKYSTSVRVKYWFGDYIYISPRSGPK